jgi:rhodanese-related sulfurtransferase
VNLRGLLQIVPTVTAAELRRELEGAEGAGLVLLDVREPAEYARGHLPGARLIPLGQLADRAGELDPAARTVAY